LESTADDSTIPRLADKEADIMSFFAAVGIFITASIAVFALLFATYQVTKRLRKKAPTPTIDPKGMPYLRPIPIPTANSPFGMRTLVWFFEIRRWVLTENWTYRLKDGTEIILPADFEFDGASIPRIFWGILSPVGLLLIPGLIHDYGYKYNQLWELTDEGQVRPYPGAGQEPDKVFWDKLFREVAKDVNGFWLINAVAWLAVAVGGNGTWRRHREVDAKPDKPRVVQS
jgi:hypothetical protein